MDDVAAGNTGRVTGSATVVGGGIGGLAAAVALRRAGWDVVVHERRADPASEGSGISVWPNALRALDALGLGDAVRDAGTTQAAGGIRDRRGRWLVRTDADTLRRRHGDAIVVLARADLLAILGGALPPGVLTTGSEITAPPGTDLVVGADGIGSTLRRHVAPDARLRSTGTVAWRLTATVPPGEDPPTEGGESWGDGEYAGVAPLPASSSSAAGAGAGGRAYLWVVVPESAPDDLDNLRERFAGWHDPIPTLLGRVEEPSVLRTGLSWLPPLRTFVRGRVVLLGDAAHAMTPNLGQGGGLALEDAATLGICAPPDGDVEEGLARYDALRRARTARLTRMSRTAGLVAGLHGRIPTAVRDAAVRAIPSALTVRGLDGVLDWTPPTG